MRIYELVARLYTPVRRLFLLEGAGWLSEGATALQLCRFAVELDEKKVRRAIVEME